MAEETGMQLYNVNQHQALLQKQAAKLDEWCLPQANMRSDALIRHALHEMSLDANLLSCTPTSIYLALLACAVTGLVPGKMRSLAFLIPYKNTKKIVDDKGNGREITVHEATFMRGWRGVKLIGFRAGLDMVSVAVHQNDDFDFDKGSQPFVRYKPALRGAGPVIGTAAWAKLPRGGLEVEYMDIEELGKIEAFATSKGGSAAWSGPFKHEMQRKSALRRLGKQLEMGEDFHRAEMIENAIDSGSVVGALDVITEGEASRALAETTTQAMAFGALPPGKPERPPISDGGTQQPPRPVQVQVPAAVTEGTRPAASARGVARVMAAKEAQAAANPTTPAASQPSPPTSSPTQNSGGQPTGASSSPSAPASKLDAAKAAVAAKTNPTASAPPPSAPTASTVSASPESPTETSSSASGDVASEPAADEQFDTSFGEDPEDSVDVSTQPPEKSVDVFLAWLAGCKTREEIMAGKGEWIEWSVAQGFTKLHPDAIRMQEGMAKRLAAVPK